MQVSLIIAIIIAGLIAIWLSYALDSKRRADKETQFLRRMCSEYEKKLYQLEKVEKMLEKGYVLVSPKRAKELEKNEQM